ncbi:MAG: helix-turn-helix transcriptional regulator [Clostridia bacterium]|nr:helix-turn-helix transcriptional regulator [Clostridia bacterium]
MINNETVGKQIARLRGDKGLTQTELGERVGVSFQAVSKWERGKPCPT